MKRWLPLLCGAVVALTPSSSYSADTQDVTRLQTAALPNAFQVHREVISGGLPAGEAGFAELKRLGIKTIISVDGAQPDVQTARRYGLRYVHLPHGYDGISPNHAERLAKAVIELPKPIYVHCHHGKHRSPAASVVACIGAGLIPPTAAVDFLQAAGTSEHYIGLYAAARHAHRFDPDQLSQLASDFPEIAEVPPLARVMVKMGDSLEHLQQCSESGWKVPESNPDIDPPHEALILKEYYIELLRSPDDRRPTDFAERLQSSRDAVAKLEALLRQDPRDGTALNDAMQRVQNDCKSCHLKYRDQPTR